MPTPTKAETKVETEPRTMIEDLVLLQAEMPPIPKTTQNTFFKNKYASLDTITEIAFPIMTKYHFAWICLPLDNEDGEPVLKYALMHSGGESIEGEIKLRLSKADVQGLGSAITYMRRYALCSVLGLVGDEDDDGNAAKAASEARKATIDPMPPEEPSVQVEKAPAKEFTDAMNELKAKFNELGIEPIERVRYVKSVLGKPQPATVEEYRQVIVALEAEEVPF